MLGSAKVVATLPVVDLARARRFYEGKLGLRLLQANTSVPQFQDAMYEAGGGTRIYLYQRTPTKADHTVVAFEVKNIEQIVKDMKSKGVVFEEYDMPGLKTVNGIAIVPNGKSAWFKDTEGNILAVTQMGK